jgi:hypothetical protein
VVKYACASVILFLVINLTRKLPNNPTVENKNTFQEML